MPSKSYGIAAAGRATVGDLDGEIERLDDEFGCGFTVTPSDGEDLAQRIVQLSKTLSSARRWATAPAPAHIRRALGQKPRDGKVGGGSEGGGK